MRRRRRARRRDIDRDVKDRLIQTRVPEKLENALKEEAKKRRLTVSHLIRNMLEDTLDLVDTVATGLDGIARSSAGLAEQVARDAGKIAAVARESFRRPDDGAAPSHDEAPSPKPDVGPASPGIGTARSAAPGPPSAVESVLAWNPVVVNRATRCADCSSELERGANAFLGIQTDPSAPPVWMCASCTGKIRD